MRDLIKTSISVLRKNWITLLLFEIFYKIFNYTVIYTIFNNIIFMITKVIGVTYISYENIYLVFQNVLSLLLIVLLFCIITFSNFFEIAAVLICCENGWKGESTSLLKLIKATFLKCTRLFRFKNIIYLMGFVLIMPLAVFPLSNNLIKWITVPEYIFNYITSNTILLILFVILFIISNCIFFIYLLSMPIILFEDKSFQYSLRKNLVRIRHGVMKMFFRICSSFLLYLFLIICLSIIGIAVLHLYIKLFYPISESEEVFRFIFMGWSRVGVILIHTIAVLLFFAVIINMYHNSKKDFRPVIIKNRKKILYYVVNTIKFLFLFWALFIFSETEIGGNLVYNNFYTTKVIAHRAGSIYAPENTVVALKTAISYGADTAEIDVQQLKDGTLVVMHDSSFKRTTGVKKSVWEVNYEEVKEYDAGSWFSESFKKEPIPTLEDMLRCAKNKIELMIELKLTGKENKLEEKTIELIKRYGMMSQCSIASMNLDVLKTVKELEPRITTVYISPVLYFDKFNLDFVDEYSVETTSLSKEIVSNIQVRGKKIYGWTVNLESTIKQNLWYGVNGIVTDDPRLVRYHIAQLGENVLLNKIVDILYD